MFPKKDREKEEPQLDNIGKEALPLSSPFVDICGRARAPLFQAFLPFLYIHQSLGLQAAGGNVNDQGAPDHLTSHHLTRLGRSPGVAQCNKRFFQSGIIAAWVACDLIFIQSSHPCRPLQPNSSWARLLSPLPISLAHYLLPRATSSSTSYVLLLYIAPAPALSRLSPPLIETPNNTSLHTETDDGDVEDRRRPRAPRE